MNTNFLFIDESKTETSTDDLLTLTSMLVSSENYEMLRSGFHSLMNALLESKEHTYNLDPPELHFREFLPEEDDSVKFKLLNEIVDLLVNCDVSIYRIGYFATKKTKENFKDDSQLYGLCWFGLQSVTTSKRVDTLIIPIMDAGFEKSFQKTVNSMSYLHKFLDIMRATPHANGVSIQHSDNMGELVFADSKYSCFIQIVDCVSGLLNVCDHAKFFGENGISSYRESLLKIAECLNPLIVYEKNTKMTFN